VSLVDLGEGADRARMITKAITFACIGVVNTLVDAGVFFLAYLAFTSSPAIMAFFARAADLCGCGSGSGLMLVTANVSSWLVAVSGSYVMNSFVTFAAESGRQLRLKSYLTFLASGLLGLVGNTTTLVVAAQFVPVWLAKGLAIGVSFLINFSMSHFVVFPASAKRSNG
jgi:putative flippase GtrA